MNRIMMLTLVVLLTAGSSCSTPSTKPDASPAAIVKQTLVLAETTATAANYIAITLSQANKLTIQQEKDVQTTTRIIDGAVRVGTAALERGDTVTAQEQIALVAVDLATLSRFIAASTGAKP